MEEKEKSLKKENEKKRIKTLIREWSSEKKRYFYTCFNGSIIRIYYPTCFAPLWSYNLFKISRSSRKKGPVQFKIYASGVKFC